jgi:peptide/nickel transport system substrate-binding protein
MEELLRCVEWARVSNLSSHYPLRADGNLVRAADQRTAGEICDRWFDAPDLTTQQTVCEQIQHRAFETVPFMPLGQVFLPAAFRKNVTDIVNCSVPLFWGVKKT